MSFPPRPFVFAAFALLVPATASAGPVSSAATGTAALLSPVSVIKNSNMDFGTLVVTGAGTAVIDPVSGSLTTTGAVTKAGTAAHPATFISTGSKNAVVHIKLPTNPITLTRVGGTETMTVSTWTLDGATNRRIPGNNTFMFAVGATANVAAGQVNGKYVGTFTVTVQYP